jgi:hypothetical protein
MASSYFHPSAAPASASKVYRLFVVADKVFADEFVDATIVLDAPSWSQVDSLCFPLDGALTRR